MGGDTVPGADDFSDEIDEMYYVEPAGPALDLEAYSDAIEAFNVVGVHILTDASSRGIVTFEEGQLRDAIDTFNEIAQEVGDDESDPLFAQLGFLVDVHNTDAFKGTFSFGIEAVFEEGQFRIWWPQ